MLSIFVPTYNHERYIAKALDGILMQKTNYRYEVLIGEDCSTDGTREVLKKYEKKYPGRFQIFYRKANMYKEQITNAADLKLRCRGKYVLCLEGDDFWTDEYKIEKQILFLETHPEYFAVAHRCVVVGEDSMPNGEKYPECMDEEYTLKHYVSEIMPGQLATFMHRNCYREEYFNTDLFFKGLVPGDRLLYYVIASYGKIYCMPEVMSAYRHIIKGGSSFSASYKYDFEKKEIWSLELVRYIETMKNKQAIKYSKLIYFINIMQGLKSKQCSLKRMRYFCRKIALTIPIALLYVKYWVRHNVLHKKMWI